MQFSETSDSTPQFETAEYVAPAGVNACTYCSEEIKGSYYRANGNMACAKCAEHMIATRPKDGHAAFMRALAFGAGGALLGLILYAFVGIVTGLMIGFVSLAVGYIVGRAMMMGSRGVGGRRYQIAAVLLTYIAVSMASIPIWIAHYAKEQPQQKQEQVQKTTEAPRADAPQQQQQQQQKQQSVIALFGYLALLGLASPFLDLQEPLNGLIGLVILFVGVQIAWKSTAGVPTVDIDGPFQP